MSGSNDEQMVYDWNTEGLKGVKCKKDIQLRDETFVDGLSSPSVQEPGIQEKVKLLNLMASLGISAVNLGYPSKNKRSAEEIETLLLEISKYKITIEPACVSHLDQEEFKTIAGIVQRTGQRVEVDCCLGVSPIRQQVEGWDLDELLGKIERFLQLVAKEGLTSMLIMEDTTRAEPGVIQSVTNTAISEGVRRFCLCDTAGHATPRGVNTLVKFMKFCTRECEDPVKLDWHGHCDRGLALPNALAAIEAGAERIHATALGVGERVGNTPMDQLMVNLKLLNWIDNDLGMLKEYCDHVARSFQIQIPPNYPIVGDNAFRTGMGTHSDAVVLALEKGDRFLADRLFSAVPAGEIGRKQIIEIGPWSGIKTIEYCLKMKGFEPTQERIQTIKKVLEEMKHPLTDDEIDQLLSP